MRITCSYKDTQKVWQTSESEVIVGRSEEKGLIILDLTPDQRVSRLHARIWETNGVCWIEDLNSSRGTSLNGVEIKGRGQQEVLVDASVVIGQTTLRIDLGESHSTFHKTKYLELGTVLLPRSTRMSTATRSSTIWMRPTLTWSPLKETKTPGRSCSRRSASCLSTWLQSSPWIHCCPRLWTSWWR